MARVGTVELPTANMGWLEIEVYDPADFDFAPIELPTTTGAWGVPFLVSPSEADTPLEVYTTARGWQGINTVAFTLIDAFEDANLDEYLRSEAGADIDISTRAGYQGNYGLRLQSGDVEMAVSHPTYSPALDYYPQRGDKFEWVTRGRGGDSFDTGGRSTVLWALQETGLPAGEPFNPDDVVEYYMVSMDSRDFGHDAESFVLHRMNADGNHIHLDEMSMTEWRDDVWYRPVVDFGFTTLDIIDVKCYERVDGEWVLATNQNGVDLHLSASSTALDTGGIGFDGLGGEVHWDWMRRTAPLG